MIIISEKTSLDLADLVYLNSEEGKSLKVVGESRSFLILDDKPYDEFRHSIIASKQNYARLADLPKGLLSEIDDIKRDVLARHGCEEYFCMESWKSRRIINRANLELWSFIRKGWFTPSLVTSSIFEETKYVINIPSLECLQGINDPYYFIESQSTHNHILQVYVLKDYSVDLFSD